MSGFSSFIPDNHPPDASILFWGSKSPSAPYGGEWCDICLYNNQVYARGQGNRSIIISQTWQALNDPDDTILSCDLFGKRSFNNPALVVVSCKNTVYQYTRGGGKKILLSSTDLLDSEEIISSLARPQCEPSCCFLSNLGVVRSIGPGKHTGHMKSDLKIPTADHCPFSKCFDKAEVMMSAMRCLPKNDKIISIQFIPMTLAWRFTTEKGGIVATRKDYNRRNDETFSDAVLNAVPDLTTIQANFQASSSSTSSAGESKNESESESESYEARERKTAKEISYWQSLYREYQVGYGYYLPQPTTAFEMIELENIRKEKFKNKIAQNR